jgi:hypothetical protein
MSKIEALRRALRELLAEHERDGMVPTSGRFLFYELVQAGTIPKHATGARRADQDMGDALTSLRESGEIPWDWIVDETREIDDYTGYDSIAGGVDAFLNAIHLDPWNGDAPLILNESRSLAGVLRSLAREYGVKIAATNGQCAGFLHTKVAPRLHDGQRVLYLGDYDLAGNDIEANTRAVLERYHSLTWERLALTAEQVREYGLTPIIKSDRRFKNGGAHEAVETEALSQRVIVQIVRDRLNQLLPEPLEAVLAREEEERERLRRVLARGRRRGG